MFWPGEFHGLYSPWGHKELEMTERSLLLFPSLHLTVHVLSWVCFFVTSPTVAHQAPLSRGFFLVRILEWVAISYSGGSSQPSDQTCVSCIGKWILRHLGIPNVIYSYLNFTLVTIKYWLYSPFVQYILIAYFIPNSLYVLPPTPLLPLPFPHSPLVTTSFFSISVSLLLYYHH